MQPTSKNVNLSMVRGDTMSFAFEVDGVDHLDAAFFTCKVNAEDYVPVFQKRLDYGITVASPGKYRVRIAPEDTDYVEVGSYYYDLEIQINDDVYTILKGRLKIEQDVTRGNEE